MSNIDVIIFKATEAADSHYRLEYALWLDQRTSYKNVYWTVSSGVSSSSAFFSINDLAQDTWHYLAGVWDGSTQKIYLDGVEKHTENSPVATMNDVSHSLYMGGSSGSIRLFPGTIDEVHIWSSALTQSEIQANIYSELTGNEEGLASYWNFNEGEGETLYDRTGNDNHGTFYGAT